LIVVTSTLNIYTQTDRHRHTQGQTDRQTVAVKTDRQTDSSCQSRWSS